MRDDCISGKGEAKSLSFVVRSRGPEVATKKFNVFAKWSLRLRARQGGNSVRRSC